METKETLDIILPVWFEDELMSGEIVDWTLVVILTNDAIMFDYFGDNDMFLNGLLSDEFIRDVHVKAQYNIAKYFDLKTTDIDNTKTYSPIMIDRVIPDNIYIKNVKYYLTFFFNSDEKTLSIDYVAYDRFSATHFTLASNLMGEDDFQSTFYEKDIIETQKRLYEKIKKIM